MAKRKYSIISEDGEAMGFMIIEQDAVLEHVIQNSYPLDGPVADVALLFASLVGFTGVAWLLPAPAWVAPSVGLSVTAALAGIKAWRSGGAVEQSESPSEVTIKLESWGDEGRVLLDEIKDQTIGLDDWRKVAKAVIVDGRNFSRPALSNYVSQTSYHKIKDELSRLNMAHRNGNAYILSPRGLAFLRKMVDLPY